MFIASKGLSVIQCSVQVQATVFKSCNFFGYFYSHWYYILILVHVFMSAHCKISLHLLLFHSFNSAWPSDAKPAKLPSRPRLKGKLLWIRLTDSPPTSLDSLLRLTYHLAVCIEKRLLSMWMSPTSRSRRCTRSWWDSSNRPRAREHNRWWDRKKWYVSHR